MIGSAIAPVTLLFVQSLWGGAAPSSAPPSSAPSRRSSSPCRASRSSSAPYTCRSRAAMGPSAAGNGLRLLLSPPILLNLVFFILLSMVAGGLNQYLVVGLEALHGTPPVVANAALTGLLTLSAVGVLVGGAIAGRVSRHNLVTAAGLSVSCVTTALIGLLDPGAFLLVLIVSLGGFANGMAIPSRDMIVRSVTPPGAFGRVFGFVTTGFHIGGIVAPLIFAQFLDHGHPRGVFLYIAACALVAIATVAFGMSGRRSA
jgi:MFS family permease